VGERRRWTSKRGCSFTGGWCFPVLPPSDGTTVKNGTFEINMASSDRRHERRNDLGSPT
jgi:hypothetical protein